MILGLAQWVKDPVIAVSCGVGRRRGLDPVSLWLWCRPAATTPIRPLAWEPPYAVGAALKRTKRQKKRKKETTQNGQGGKKKKKKPKKQTNKKQKGRTKRRNMVSCKTTPRHLMQF